MWFGQGAEEYDVTGEIFQEAIKQAGFESRIISQKDFTGSIPDEIIAEIKRSKYIVADLTGARPSVYYEAGFAHGLNIPVIFTCNKVWLNNAKENPVICNLCGFDKSDMYKLHFDIAHHNCIVWSNKEELKQRLQQRLRRLWRLVLL